MKEINNLKKETKKKYKKKKTLSKSNTKKKNKHIVYGEPKRRDNVHHGTVYGAGGNIWGVFLENIYYENMKGLGREDINALRNFTQSFFNGTGKDLNFKSQGKH